MDDRTMARGVAVGRVAFGLLMLLIPNVVLARVSDVRPGPLVWMCRAFGIRDVVLGAGALMALRDGEDAQAAAHWVQMGAVADTTDAVAAVVWHRELRWSGAASTLALAVPAAAAGHKAAAGLRADRSSPPAPANS